jgi:predicted nucleotidyltransferase
MTSQTLCYNIVVMIPRSETSMAVYRQSFIDRLTRQRDEREAYRLQALAKIQAVLPAVASGFSSVRHVYIFGSILRPGQFHAKSDVDIGVVGVTAEEYFALWRELEAAFPERPVDLRDVSMPSFFADTIQKTGLLIYERTN